MTPSQEEVMTWQGNQMTEVQSQELLGAELMVEGDTWKVAWRLGVLLGNFENALCCLQTS